MHGHLYLKKATGNMRCRSDSALTFQGVKPHHSAWLEGARLSKGWAGAYYVTAPKQGTLYTSGNLERNADFPVNPQWIFGMLESGKLTYQSARSELIRCAKAVDRNLRDIDTWYKAKEQMALQLRVEQRQLEIRAGLTPFPTWPVVDKWLAEVTMPAQSRKRMLVLQGPSRTGKTEFVRCLFPPGRVLELNCAGVSTLCLGGFDAALHRCLLWDEASPKLVSANRKVLQHPACWVDLGHSPTGQHVVHVFLDDCCSVIATNSWHSEVAQLATEDQAWLAANAVVFDVTQPLWEFPVDGDAQRPLPLSQDFF